MPKLYSLTQIILAEDKVVERNKVFDATVAQAKQFDKLKAARPATEQEIKAAEKAAAEADGSAFSENAETAARPAVDAQPVRGAVDISMPDSGAPGDPQSKPKGK